GHGPSHGNDGGACSPPLLVPFEKAGGALLGALQRLDPVVEQPFARRRDGVAALRGTGGGVVPFRRDESFLLEPAQQPVEVSHLDAGLAGQLRQPLEQVVAVRRMLPQEEQQRGLREPLDPRENPPTTLVVPACARASHSTSTCKKHM